MAQDFVTTGHNDFNWPFSRPVVGRPCEPPVPSPTPAPAPPPVAPYCHCDAHAYSPQLEQYKQLLQKEEQLCADYSKLKRQMVVVTNDILDHPCDDNDTKMATIYQTSYKRRPFPVTGYRPLVAASQSDAPVPAERSRLGRPGRPRCCRDPTRFHKTFSPVVRSTVQPSAAAHTALAPEPVLAWFADYPGRSEYADAYSKAAKASWRAAQRYREPLPSSRRREDDRCL